MHHDLLVNPNEGEFFMSNSQMLVAEINQIQDLSHSQSERVTVLPDLDLVDGGCFERMHVAAFNGGFDWYRTEIKERERLKEWSEDDEYLCEDLFYFVALIGDEDTVNKEIVTQLIDEAYADHIVPRS